MLTCEAQKMYEKLRGVWSRSSWARRHNCSKQHSRSSTNKRATTNNPNAASY